MFRIIIIIKQCKRVVDYSVEMIYYIYFNKHMLLIQFNSCTTYRASQLPDLHILCFYRQGPIRHINYFEIKS